MLQQAREAAGHIRRKYGGQAAPAYQPSDDELDYSSDYYRQPSGAHDADRMEYQQLPRSERAQPSRPSERSAYGQHGVAMNQSLPYAQPATQPVFSQPPYAAHAMPPAGHAAPVPPYNQPQLYHQPQPYYPPQYGYAVPSTAPVQMTYAPNAAPAPYGSDVMAWSTTNTPLAPLPPTALQYAPAPHTHAVYSYAPGHAQAQRVDRGVGPASPLPVAHDRYQLPYENLERSLPVNAVQAPVPLPYTPNRGQHAMMRHYNQPDQPQQLQYLQSHAVEPESLSQRDTRHQDGRTDRHKPLTAVLRDTERMLQKWERELSATAVTKSALRRADRASAGRRAPTYRGRTRDSDRQSSSRLRQPEDSSHDAYWDEEPDEFDKPRSGVALDQHSESGQRDHHRSQRITSQEQAHTVSQRGAQTRSDAGAPDIPTPVHAAVEAPVIPKKAAATAVKSAVEAAQSPLNSSGLRQETVLVDDQNNVYVPLKLASSLQPTSDTSFNGVRAW